jgi:hypothetical protein
MLTFDQLGKKTATIWPIFIGMPAIKKQPWEARFTLMAETTVDSSPAGRRWNPVVVTIALLLLAPLAFVLPFFILLAGALVHSVIVPDHTATARIPDLDTDLTLRFYSTWADNDSGRYLYINTPRGKIKIYMTAFDWAHNARTSIYLTPERRIAVLGPMGDDHLVSVDTLTTSNVAAASESEKWAYIGAFDFQFAEDGRRPLRFVSAAEQAECIPMRWERPDQTYKVRASVRQNNCHHVLVSSGAK